MLLGAHLLPILLGGVVLAAVARRFAGRRRDGLQRAVQRLADATMRVVAWILLATPLGVLALSFGMAKSAGESAVGFMTAHVVIVSAILLLFTALLYPLTAALSGVPVRELARALAPVQLVAVSTRSSLASLPALVESGRDRLALPVAATGFVLPLAVAIFKLNRAISPLVMLLFLGHVFGVPLGPERILPFLCAIFLLSFSVPGIPGGNPGITTLPLFVAAGVPAQGVLILDAVDAIPDIFKTVTNVTGDLSAATILSGRGRAGAG